VVELYRLTRDPKYLELGGIFVDMRGSQPGGTDVNQTHVPLRKETEAVGHSVVGPYLWAGAADVYAETGEKALLDVVHVYNRGGGTDDANLDPLMLPLGLSNAEVDALVAFMQRAMVSTNAPVTGEKPIPPAELPK